MSGDRRLGYLVGRRRRAASGDREDNASIASADNSQSDISHSSTAHTDMQGGDSSDVSEPDTAELAKEAVTLPRIATDSPVCADSVALDNKHLAHDSAVVVTHPQFGIIVDTDMMLNGLSISNIDQANKQPAVSFDDSQATTTAGLPSSTAKSESLADRRKREHDEYKRKRDADPTFVPNRGNFFMHDARSANAQTQKPFRKRERNVDRVDAPDHQGSVTRSNTYTKQGSRNVEPRWAHDLFDAVKDDSVSRASTVALTGKNGSTRGKPNVSIAKLLGNVQIRVRLPTMKEAIRFAAVPVRCHTVLPGHRSPLRRDKAVRVALLCAAPSYVFPSEDRSFVFVPRALRPKQQPGSSHMVSEPASRRGSLYGGSKVSHSGSVSRRSSTVRGPHHDDGLQSTASSAISVKPVVRLPRKMTKDSNEPAVVPPSNTAAHDSLQEATVEHHRALPMMHQPKPQKAIAVSGIESPAALSLHIPTYVQQPFDGQLPSGYMSAQTMNSMDPRTGFPMTASDSIPGHSMASDQGLPQPMFGCQYALPNYQHSPIPGFDPRSAYGGYTGSDFSARGLVAHESNGMVYFFDPVQSNMHMPMAPPPPPGVFPPNEFLVPTDFAVPGMAAQSPDGTYFYQQEPKAMMYYPPLAAPISHYSH